MQESVKNVHKILLCINVCMFTCAHHVALHVPRHTHMYKNYVHLDNVEPCISPCVELELKKVEEDNIKENHAIHFTCELKFNGTIPVNAHTSIEITHNKSHPINHCVNKTLCEANVSQAAIPKDEGYYFCSASIKDNSLQHWIHISSKPVFVNIDPDKIAYFGETIGGPIGGSVLFIVVAIAVATIVMRRWKRNFLRRQEDFMQRYWLLGGNGM